MKAALAILLLCASARAASWPCGVVTYHDATPRRFHDTTAAAFAQWEAVTGLKFEHVKHGAQIEVVWDKNPIAFFLAFTTWTAAEEKLASAEIRINARQYRWHVGKPYGIQLRFARKSLAEFGAVILHEAGHALGLPHSLDSADVMYPLISGLTSLSEGDKAAVKALYGE